MFEYINYLSNKKELVIKMNSVKEHFSELNGLGIDVSEAISKIDSAIDCVQADALSIVLVGAFSDGKTSVVAGWLNEKVSNMKIDSDESSDEILRYTPTSLPEGCQIVDTPGLFGDKIGSDENGATIVLSDMTKRYISEANVILYVVPAKNPIKDSHKACIRWILNDLNKLSSIIFVINKMDDIVDLTDEEEFEAQKKIKSENLRSKLLECGVSQQDADKVKIVCVSAAPDGRDIDEWKQFREEYLKRSHIGSLEEATNAVLKNSREALIAKTGCDVLNDELSKVLAEISRQENAIDEIVLPEKRESLKRNKKDLEALKKRIRQSRDDIKDELKKLNKSKISKIRSASMDNFRDILEDEIGMVPEKEGSVLAEEITSIFNRYAELFSGWSVNVGDKFQSEYEKQNRTVGNLMKKGATGASLGMKGAGSIGVNAFKQAIFAGRDVLGKLGVVIKFKPWQVVKMATFATKAIPIIGGAIDVVSNLMENINAERRNSKFEKAKEDTKESINEVFIEYFEKINDEAWFFENFAPGVKILEEQVAIDEKGIAELEETKDGYMKWSKKVKNIECCIL